MPPAATHTWPVTLEHGDLLLRPFRRSDQEEWWSLRARNREWLRRWEATNPVPGSGVRTFAEMVKNLNRSAKDGTSLPWVICLRTGADGTPVIAGQLSVSPIMRGSAHSAAMGYWIDQSHAGQGIVPTAVALATDHCFTQLSLHRVEINLRPENAASRRVVEKLGFRYEGRRKAYLHIDGDWRDHDSYALTAPEVSHGLLARFEGERHDTADTPK
ncbi:GNAT family N-acetyltransferase [Citricoccus sp. GCM10030269]|uniref:GNAT family N-acetyltransferase n=1 Tax=Citricoccus sp. GCM10030269 TaxID=3273388 RepID=UPI00361D47B9